MGEYKAEILMPIPVGPRLKNCRVSFVNASGVRHAVDVTAESLYEAAAAARGLAALKRADWCDGPGPGATLEVEVIEVSKHTVSLKKLREWLEHGTCRSPRERLIRDELKAAIG